MKRKAFLAFRVVFWFYAAFLLVMSLIPSAGIQEINLLDQEWRIDYPLHTASFFLLTLFAYLASSNGTKIIGWRILLSLCFTLALLTEFLQLFSGRTFNLLDIASNLLGMGLGIVVVYVIDRYKKKRLANQ